MRCRVFRVAMNVAAGVLMVALALEGCQARTDATLENDRFVEVHDGLPIAWHPLVWAANRTRFDVVPPSSVGGDGVLGITNEQPNDARLCQTVAIDPGATYRVSAKARTDAIGVELFGALITIEPRVADSSDLRGTQPWQELEVTAAANGLTSWEICLRLGSYGNLNTGSAYFREVTLETVTRSTHWFSTVPSDPGYFVWAAFLSPLVSASVGGLLLAYGLGILGSLRPIDPRPTQQ